MVCDLTML